MDFGIVGNSALVCVGREGLGKGCAMVLAGDGVTLTIVARGTEVLEATAEEIRNACGVTMTSIATDIASEARLEEALAARPEPDIIVSNAGGHQPAAPAIFPMMIGLPRMFHEGGCISRVFAKRNNLMGRRLGVFVQEQFVPIHFQEKCGVTA